MLAGGVGCLVGGPGSVGDVLVGESVGRFVLARVGCFVGGSVGGSVVGDVTGEGETGWCSSRWWRASTVTPLAATEVAVGAYSISSVTSTSARLPSECYCSSFSQDQMPL